MGDRASAAMKIAFIVARVFNSLRCIFESAFGRSRQATKADGLPHPAARHACQDRQIVAGEEDSTVL
jgi:hypothetical protein